MGQKTDDKGQRKARARAKAKDGSPTRTLGEDERQKAGFPRYRGQQTEDRGQEKEKARARAKAGSPIGALGEDRRRKKRLFCYWPI